MATKEIGGPSSSSAEKSNLSPMKIALEETVHYAEQLEKGVKMLMWLKGSNESLEKEICDSIDGDRAKFIHHFSQLTGLIAKEQQIEVEIIGSIVKAIGSSKRKAKEHNEAAMAQIERHQRRMKCVDSVVDAMVSQLSNLAGGQVAEIEDQKDL